MVEPTVITYLGIRFRRYPDATGWAERAYFTPGIADRQRGVRRLHEEIYRDHHGDPPEGWHVHHADGDHLNNDPTNLIALDPAHHQERHAEERRGKCTPMQADALALARVAAAEWHRSDVGRAWHREHGRTVWQRREPRRLACDQCGQEYDTLARHGAERFCSNACRAAARRASGMDDETRRCAICEAAFRVNRYAKTKTCSRSCGRYLQLRRVAA